MIERRPRRHSARAIKLWRSHAAQYTACDAQMGEYRWHHTMGEPLRDPHGKIIQWYGLSVDIDDRKRAEETVRKSERELRTLIDVMPAYVGTALPDGTADFFSQRWLDYFGQTREEAMGWGWATCDPSRRRRSSIGKLAGGIGLRRTC